MSMWIVMSSSAKMPRTCRGNYRNVAIVHIDQEYTSHGYRPKMISARARGVLQVRHLGRHNVGRTERCAFRRALIAAEELAYKLNNVRDMADASLLINATCA